MEEKVSHSRNSLYNRLSPARLYSVTLTRTPKWQRAYLMVKRRASRDGGEINALTQDLYSSEDPITEPNVLARLPVAFPLPCRGGAGGGVSN